MGYRTRLVGLVLVIALGEGFAADPPASREHPAATSPAPVEDPEVVRARLIQKMLRQSPPEIPLLVEKFHLDGPVLDDVLQRGLQYKETIRGINQWFVAQRHGPGEQDPKRIRKLVEQRVARMQQEEISFQRDLMGLMPEGKKKEFPTVWLACRALAGIVNPPEWSAEQKREVFMKTREHACVIAAFQTLQDQETYLFRLRGWIRREVLPMTPAPKPAEAPTTAEKQKKSDEDKYSSPESPKKEKNAPDTGNTVNTADSSCDGDVGGW